MIIDGRAIAEEVYASLAKMEGNRARARLGILVGASTPVIEQFVRIKQKAAERIDVAVERVDVPEGADTESALGILAELMARSDGVIVQLPLPEALDADIIINAVSPEKDVDGISAVPLVLPPVAGAVAEICAHAGVIMEGKRAVVVGSGRLVGKPVARLLEQKGAYVQVLTKGDSLAPLKEADIVVLGAGEPGLVRPEHVREGVVLIDAGTSEAGGRVAGDADPACAEVASVFTPVPGGVGPIAVAMIFKNLYTLTQNSHS